MNCRIVRKNLLLSDQGRMEGSPADTAIWQGHLDQCPECQEWAKVHRLYQEIVQSAPCPQVPDDFEERLRERLAKPAEALLPHFPTRSLFLRRHPILSWGVAAAMVVGIGVIVHLQVGKTSLVSPETSTIVRTASKPGMTPAMSAEGKAPVIPIRSPKHHSKSGPWITPEAVIEARFVRDGQVLEVPFPEVSSSDPPPAYHVMTRPKSGAQPVFYRVPSRIPYRQARPRPAGDYVNVSY